MSEIISSRYIPSRAGDIFECCKCGRYMPCKIVNIDGTRVPICIVCLNEV